MPWGPSRLLEVASGGTCINILLKLSMPAERNKILVVDDDPTFRGRLVKALAARGYDAFEAADATSAIERAKEFRPGRAIIDLRMPGKSGIDLIPELVEINPSIQILV